LKEEEFAQLKKLALLLIFFIASFLVLFTIHLIFNDQAEKKLKINIQTIISNSNIKNSELGQSITLKNSNWAFMHAWKSKDTIMLAVKITGKAGPYTAIFKYTPEQGTSCLGIAEQILINPASKGFSPQLIHLWENRITKFIEAGEK